VRTIKLKTAVMTRIGRHDSGYQDLLREAISLAFDRVDPSRITRTYFSSFAPSELCGIADPIGTVMDTLAEVFPLVDGHILGPYRTGGEALFCALEHRSGARVTGDTMVLACEKMTHVDAATAAGLLAPRVNPVEKLYGATLPALSALVTRAYLRSFDVPYRALHLVAAKNHRNAARNPQAHFQREIPLHEIASSPLVADPLRRHHCAPMSDGAAACVIGDDGDGVSFRGWGAGSDSPLFHEREHLGRFRAAAVAAAHAFSQARVGPEEIDVVEVHDAFSPFELINLEEMGFFRMGEAWHALADGELDIGGRLAVNPSGGMKARGHPIGVCGLSSVVEMYQQLRGQAGDRQHPGARLGAIQSAGGVSQRTYAFVLGAE
jgi:acetyl-CoA C-acetyltransferase